jgi:hypothetical protein
LLYRSSIRPRKKPLGLVNFDAKLAVSTAGPLVMLLAAYNVLLVVLPTPALQSEWLALLLFEKTP